MQPGGARRSRAEVDHAVRGGVDRKACKVVGGGGRRPRDAAQDLLELRGAGARLADVPGAHEQGPVQQVRLPRARRPELPALKLRWV
jgi:hypothetical protein